MTLELPLILLLIGSAFLTSIVSAIVGLVGGVLLLGIMSPFFPPLVLIPLHGLVQFCSNSSRVWIHRKVIRKDLFWAFFVGAVLGATIGSQLVIQLPERLFTIIIAIFILLVTWAPQPRSMGRSFPRYPLFFLLGCGVTFFGLFFGVTGSLQAPFYVRENLSKESLIGTSAATQAIAHVAKLFVYGALGFQFWPYWPLLSGMVIAVFFGTYVGSSLLKKIDKEQIVRAIKIILTLLSLRMIFTAF